MHHGEIALFHILVKVDFCDTSNEISMILMIYKELVDWLCETNIYFLAAKLKIEWFWSAWGRRMWDLGGGKGEGTSLLVYL